MSLDVIEATQSVFSSRPCQLGEGPLWDGKRQSLFWFDIIEKKLFEKSATTNNTWQFKEYVSAIGKTQNNQFFLASETGLWVLDVVSGTKLNVCDLEADNPATRSNDGRADPWGGFWIGTMGKNAEHQLGAIYRWYDGELREIVPGVTVPNGICFDDQSNRAYFADTLAGKVWSVEVSPTSGWPINEPSVFIDVESTNIKIDGAIVDAEGNYVAAIMGEGGLYVYNPEGNIIQTIATPTPFPTCPAFGGLEYNDVFVTTASYPVIDLPSDDQPHGQTFMLGNALNGKPEPEVNTSKIDLNPNSGHWIAL